MTGCGMDRVRRIRDGARWVAAGLAASLAGCASPSDPAVAEASRQFRLEEPHLVDKIAADTLRVDAPALDAKWLVEMLGQRNVQMIEVVPRAVEGDPQLSRVAMAGYDGSRGWLLSVAPYMFVQFRLSWDGDESCRLEGSVPGNLRLKHAPMHPRACLSMKISPRSEAHYRLRYLTAQEAGGPFARWAMVDVRTGATLASLPTGDGPGGSSTRDFVMGQTPFVSLARLVDNRDAPRSAPYPAYIDRHVQATPPPDGPESPEGAMEVESRYRFVDYTRDEVDARFSGWDAKWIHAVEDAERTGWGYADAAMLDQGRGERLFLAFGPYGHHYTGAAEQGFYVISGFWNERGRNWLARYDRNGKLEWKVWVQPPQEAGEPTICRSGPLIFRTTADEVVLEGYCDPESDHWLATAHVREIVISKRDLPRMAPSTP